jgi:hypothetical protein
LAAKLYFLGVAIPWNHLAAKGFATKRQRLSILAAKGVAIQLNRVAYLNRQSLLAGTVIFN